MGDATIILQIAQLDDNRDTAELLPIVYDELRKLAAKKLIREAPGQTLQATALVHEVYLKLTQNFDGHWNDRDHFMAAAAEAMRRILVDSARHKQTAKRGGSFKRAPLIEDCIAAPCDDLDILHMDAALEKLERTDPQLAMLVKLRFFAGMTLAEVSQSMNVPRRSVDRLWAYARAWLLREVDGEPE